MSHSPLAELAVVQVATPPAEALQHALHLVAPQLRADRFLLCVRDPAQAQSRARIVFV